ncbi:MAG: tRNA (N6-isopentenyl adenosine(37)-C2)-methylthiotransferase MiaB [Syntrophorhabdaceae bacterium]|nr:tRNA (N6-isopentenyl adenosine(37)-C2)-methylthiotransferase MiaB [Syntrophorhabdaceae bacterium]
MKFCIETFGCQMNEHDSEKMAYLLASRGHEQVFDAEEAEVVIVNTCCVRKKAEEKFYSLMGRLKRIKSKKGTILGVTGCIAQLEKEGILNRVPFIDFSLGPSNIGKIETAIKNSIEKGKHFDFSENGGAPIYISIPDRTERDVKAYVSIMKGCNNFCSYCIVPYVRGREVSRRSEDIIKEVRGLAESGVKEVTLLGQNVNSYNKGTSDMGFPELLKAINKIEGIERIRFVTSHPKDLSDALINCFGDLEKLCEHIHLPFQSGSDKILESMNRGYTSEDYRRKIDLLRNRVPHIAITADCIVGFPGEDEQDFEKTMELIRDVEFDGLFSFVYSPRKYTLAWSLEMTVPREEALSRLKVLQDTQKAITLKKNRAMEGSVVQILIEGKSKNGGEEYTGRTRTNKIVNLPGERGMIGNLIDVEILKGYANSLKGRPVYQQMEAIDGKKGEVLPEKNMEVLHAQRNEGCRHHG